MAASPAHRPPVRSARLFYQIALRLALVAALFAVLEILIVVAMYAHDEGTLADDLVTLESERIAHLIHTHGLQLSAEQIFPGSSTRALSVFDEHGASLLTENPGRLPLPDAPQVDLHSETAREVRGEAFFLSGIRRVEIDGRTLWLALAISGQGVRPFLPALYKEVIDHALLPLIPLLLLLLLFNVVVVRRMLAPLERAVIEVDALDPSDISRRIHLPESPIEVRSLLRSMNRALDRLERAMGTLRRFTADAAHELRTPLAVMTLTIDRLAPSAARQKLREDAAVMARLINQMLDLARAESQEDLRGAQSDLHELANRVAAELTPLAISLGNSIRYRNEGSVAVQGHADLLERALRNLIENALSHTAPGTEVEVVVGPQPRISVRDRGPGIPAAVREQVFQRFWRADRRGSGAGLGLAIARSIMEACGGRIDIADAPGGGSIISLVFPEPVNRSDEGSG